MTNEFNESYPAGLTLRDTVDILAEIEDDVEFRKKCDLLLFTAWETDSFVYPNKLKADVAGALYCVLHRRNG